jgi:hypothetical protein
MRLNGKLNTSKFAHCSLDLYLLQMHSAELAEVLGCFSTFGRRILPLIRRFPDSDVWWLCEEVSIQRRHWFLLCDRMMNLLRLLGLECANDDFPSPSKAPIPLRPWPNLSDLRSAAMGVLEVFGVFGVSDCAQPTMEILYWPHLAKHIDGSGHRLLLQRGNDPARQ